MSTKKNETQIERVKPVVPERAKPTPPPTRYITDSVEVDYDKYREKSILNEKENKQK